MALRTAKSLQHRTPLPMQFVQEVNEKVAVLKQDGEPDDTSYLDHKILKQEHDEQLLLWMQRCAFIFKFLFTIFINLLVGIQKIGTFQPLLTSPFMDGVTIIEGNWVVLMVIK